MSEPCRTVLILFMASKRNSQTFVKGGEIDFIQATPVGGRDVRRVELYSTEMKCRRLCKCWGVLKEKH